MKTTTLILALAVTGLLGLNWLYQTSHARQVPQPLTMPIDLSFLTR